MSNENNKNNQNMEQENKHNISWWKKLLGLNPTYKLGMILVQIGGVNGEWLLQQKKMILCIKQ